MNQEPKAAVSYFVAFSTAYLGPAVLNTLDLQIELVFVVLRLSLELCTSVSYTIRSYDN